MQADMDTDSGALQGMAGDDLSALAWVHGELRRSLENAHKSLRRYLKDAEASLGGDLDAVDPSVLRSARTQIHQGVGALELVGLPAVADVLRASESAVQRMIGKPALMDAAAVEVIERVSFALLDFLTRQLARKPVSPVMLFPQYRAALQLAGAERVHPADLWTIDWQWRELPNDASAQPLVADEVTRGAMESETLALMRDPTRSGSLRRMSDLCAGLAAGVRRLTQGSTSGTLWQLAAAVFEAQGAGLLQPDVFSKRVASRLLAQLRASSRGQPEPSDRLAQDLLFFCSRAQAPTPLQAAPRLEAVRRTWRLQDHPVADYETVRLGRFDPSQLALARKRVAAAKDAWSAVAGGENHRIGGLPEQFALVGESLGKLFPSGEVLAQALQTTVAQTVSSGQSPPAPLAMEVATGILYLDASLEDGELDQPELGERIQRLAGRIDAVRGGADPQPLDLWMEELYRRVSDRQTMGSVVAELRASLSEVEKQIDQYFRNPVERSVLIPVPAQLSSMRGVLSVLGMDQASSAALHMRNDVDALAQTEVDPQRAIQAGTFDRLADNLGALSFLIDMLSVQPQLAKSLFRFDPDTGSLTAVMGKSDRVSAFAQLDEAPQGEAPASTEPLLAQVQSLGMAAASTDVSDATLARDAERLAQQALAADQPDLARLLGSAHAGLRESTSPAARRAMRAELAAAVAGLGAAAEALPPPAPVPPPKPAPQGGTGLEDDLEMREIFIEEAREVVTDARAAVGRLMDSADNAQDMTAVRRAFHTLKGSSRMVGLKDFGEAAWSCEQLYNARLAQAPQMDGPLRLFTTEALDYMHGWVEAIAEGRQAGHQSAAVSRSADALRLEGQRVPITAPAAAEERTVVVAPTPAGERTVIVAPPPAAERTIIASPPPASERTIIVSPPPAEERTIAVLPTPKPAAPEPAPEPAPAPQPAEDTTTITLRRGAAEDEVEPLTLDFGGAIETPAAGPTIVMPVSRQPAEPTPNTEPQAAEEPDFELSLPDLDDEPRTVAAVQPLTERLPELPSAADLDLSDAAPAEAADFALDLGGYEVEEVAPAPTVAEPPPAQPVVEPVAEPVLSAEDSDEQVKVIGTLRISIPLFNIYLNEADEQSRRLVTELAEWSLEHERHAVSDTAIALAHSLAGNSATVGYTDLSALARALEHALMRSHAAGHGRAGEPQLFSDVAEEIRRLLHQFAAGFLRSAELTLLERLAAHERLPAPPVETLEPVDDLEPEVEISAPDVLVIADAAPAALAEDDDIQAVDAIDAELFPIFEEEADELLPQLLARLREWHDHPGNPGAPAACMRTLHTFKGGARLAGAMRLGEMAHRLESGVEHLSAEPSPQASQIDPLLARADAMVTAYEALRRRGAVPAPAVVAPVAAPVMAPLAVPVAPPAAPEQLPALEPVPVDDVDITFDLSTTAGADVPDIDWSRFAGAPGAVAPVAAQAATPADKPAAGGQAAVRVRANLLDRLVNNAGEVSITRARIESNVQLLQGSLGELTESLEKLRRQLRDIEVQAESQISSRMEAAKAQSMSFDPLEMDRFTRFQELTRFMAESVNDVATLQRSLQRTLQSAEDELAAQARLTRELQEDLLRTRMVEFESVADRLYRTVRQAAKETGKQVRLDIVGGGIEIDRGVLERMAGSFEHLLRNSVAHGVEAPAARESAGKDAGGLITVTVAQSGNEVAVEFADDGGGLDLARIRQRGIERGLITADAQVSDAELQQMIFAPGFSTAETVTELAGRGVGLDVVRAEVNAMGGRIEIHSERGRGSRFRLLLPLTTAVTQVVMLRCGGTQVAVPSPLIEIVRRVPTAECERAYASGFLSYSGEEVPYFWLASLLQSGTRGPDTGKTQSIIIVRSASQRVAVHVDEVVGNQEVVVKNVGPQLSRLPGLAGVTLLPSGGVALIYNPVALAAVYASNARALAAAAPAPVVPDKVKAAPVGQAPMVLVVDDSLTVRRVTQRLLSREGYRVVTAKDGLDALERLAEERPVMMLSDIEMPRMDGFDLVRNVRGDPRLQGLPVVMISSRTAQKHRDYAAELGVNHYLGKPYSEEELLSLVARYAQAAASH
jgi:chemosensory pili system protein ChpA (sensor histidine kinase/response regulator)